MILSCVPRRAGNTKSLYRRSAYLMASLAELIVSIVATGLLRNVGAVAQCETWIVGRLLCQVNCKWINEGPWEGEKAQLSAGNRGRCPPELGFSSQRHEGGSLLFFPHWQSLVSVSYLKQKCNALPPSPPLPSLSISPSVRRAWGLLREKAAELGGRFYFFQSEMDFMLALLVPSTEPAATEGKKALYLSFSQVVETGKCLVGGERGDTQGKKIMINRMIFEGLFSSIQICCFRDVNGFSYPSCNYFSLNQV